ncbi:MAG: hypothetical protein L0215_18280 [Gemmataceae bacterium]|nr:hypothetical protein [Gemmataceae bacterium]
MADKAVLGPTVFKPMEHSVAKPGSLDQCEVNNVLLPNRSEVEQYFAEHPDLAAIVPGICAKVRAAFGATEELSLQLYKDPEIDDQYLTLYVRRQEYKPGIVEEIDRISGQFDGLLETASGYLLITTDFRRPGGTNVV